MIDFGEVASILEKVAMADGKKSEVESDLIGYFAGLDESVSSVAAYEGAFEIASKDGIDEDKRKMLEKAAEYMSLEIDDKYKIKID